MKGDDISEKLIFFILAIILIFIVMYYANKMLSNIKKGRINIEGPKSLKLEITKYE